VAVALARLGHGDMTPPLGAMEIVRRRHELDFVVHEISRRAELHDPQLSAAEAEALRKKVMDRVKGLLDAWANIARADGGTQYQTDVAGASPLLVEPLSKELAKRSREARQFTAGRSLRDVEPVVNLWLRSPDGFDVDEGGR